jgi:hypothetical protein
MVKIKLTAKYWKIVLSRAWDIAWHSSGVKGLTFAFLSAFIIFAMLLCLNAINILPNSWHILIGDFSAEVRTNTFYLVGAILAGFVIFIFSLVYMPAKIYDEQNKKIGRLESRRKSKTVKTDKIVFTPREEFPKLDGHEFYAYLEIYNGENDDLRDCYATLNKLFVKDAHGWLDVIQQINPNSSHLTFPAFNKEEEKIIRRKKTSRINIAKTIPNNIAFIFENGDTKGFFSIREYYLEVEINGLLGGKPIEGVVFSGFLYYIANLLPVENRPPQSYFRLYMESGEIKA